MIESYLTQNMITRGETAIADYLRSGQSDYGNIRKEAFTDLQLDLINRGYELRKLCKRFYLEKTALTKTAAYIGALSDEDFAQRMRLVIHITAQNGIAGFTLQGTDDEGVTYNDITLIADDETQGTTVTISTLPSAPASYLITSLYKKYRLKLITISTSITYTAYMIEEIYTLIHREKTRAKIYQSLISSSPEYTEKYNMYLNEYNRLITEGVKIVDVGDDEEIAEDEGKQEPLNIIFR
jgi:hypothetical protein